jgi:hypothetical protein
MASRAITKSNSVSLHKTAGRAHVDEKLRIKLAECITCKHFAFSFAEELIDGQVGLPADVPMDSSRSVISPP